MAPPKYKLHYFNVMYLAEPIRYLFAHAGIEFEDHRIEQADWPQMKPTTPWKSLPLLEFGDRKIGQSIAILRFLGRQHGYYTGNPFEDAKIDEVIDATNDLRQVLHNHHQSKDEVEKEAMKTKFTDETLPNSLKIFSELLNSNSDGFLVGKKFTIADFYMAHFLQLVQKLFGENLFDDSPAVKRHQAKVFDAPGIKEYIATRPVTSL